MTEERLFVPLSDGVRLAATLYLPETPGPWPALLEAYPYRKDDLSIWDGPYRRFRDEGDYAVCRVDVRGTGTSEGVAVDEYPEREAADLAEVVEWLAAREWCAGSVGMFGTSYAGFNTIHTAMRGAAALKAIVPIYATDDRYTDDIHYGGGIRKAIESGYPLSMVSMNALPPVPSLAGAEWRARWLERIENLVPWYGSIREQRDGPFWRRGSLRPNYDLIRVPTMLVAGWADLYRNAMLRMFERIDVPKRLLLGPWCHMSPSDSVPGPNIDLEAEMLRWWDRWLRDTPNGVDTEPPITMFVQWSTPPAPDLAEMRGEWRFEPAWPPERVRPRVLPLESAERPGRDPSAPSDILRVRGDVGTTAHIRGSYPAPYGLPIDQRPDEARSLVYEWALGDGLELLGNARLEVRVRSSEPVAFVAAKLSEVLSDGTSALVTRGLLNLTHRDSDSEPRPIAPGEAYDVSIELDAASRVFEPGARVRLAIAGSDWPNAWPPPRASDLTVEVRESRLVLPEAVGPSPVRALPTLIPVEPPAAAKPGADEDPPYRWTIEQDVYGRRTIVSTDQLQDEDVRGARVRRTESVRATVAPFEPGDASVEAIVDSEIAWPEVTARARARLELVSDAERYRFALTLDVYEDGGPIASRSWRDDVPRDLQ